MPNSDGSNAQGAAAGATPPPGDLLGDLFTLVGLPNPLTAVVTTFEQMRRGSEDFLVAVETFTRTMENVNATAERLNRLLDDVEGPIRAVAPAMSRLADTLSSPTMTALPTDLSEVVRLMGDLARRLAPLTQLAESAGSMFGLRGLLPGSARHEPAPAPPPTAPAPASKRAAAKKTPAKKMPATKTPAKKTPAKRQS
jgi:hypothetical protein